MSHADFLTLRYEFLLIEIRRVLAQRGCWQAMPALLDELHRLRETLRRPALAAA